MKKQFTKISTLAFAFLSFAAFSQQKVQPCNTYEAMEQHFAEDPQARKSYEASQEQLRTQLKNTASKSAAAVIYTIPVVFHVLYDCNSPIITDATIIQALKEVNDDYARKSADTNLIDQPFKSSYVDSEIRLMLAKRDLQGNCISGIVRHYDPEKTNWSQSIANSQFNNSYWAYTWDPTKYLNIYIVSSIISSGSNAPGTIVVGYTFKPGTWSTGNPHDAIVYNMNYLTGGSPSKSRSLSHEVGHWFNLAHTWGNTNAPGISCGDDGIADTPNTKGEQGGCPYTYSTACSQPIPANANLNNGQNIMNYSDCPRNFTSDQITHMRNTLAASVSQRDNLYTPANLAFTGVNNTGLCTPIAEFFSTSCSYTVCAGSSLSMRDFSNNSSITSFQWSADNGATVASPNASITSILFPNAGTSNVSYTVTNSQGSNVKSRQITVLDNTPGFGPIAMESFEDPGLPPNWTIDNVENDAITWEQTADAAYDQSTSYRIIGSGNPGDNSDILQMPIMDVMNNPNDILEFAYAYRKQTPTQDDALKIEGSKDCGGTWNTIYSLNSNLMQNNSGGIGTDGFTPAINEWKIYTISSHPNWQGYKSSSNVMVRFNFVEGSTGNGNNIYIDAINWYSTVGVNELTKSIHFNLYPNPSNGEANVTFNLNDPATIKVSVIDIMGREVIPTVENKYNPGAQTITINKDKTLSKGIYFVNLSHNGAKMSHKLIIE